MFQDEPYRRQPCAWHQPQQGLKDVLRHQFPFLSDEHRDAFLSMLVSYGRYLKINSFQATWHSSRLHAP